MSAVLALVILFLTVGLSLARPTIAGRRIHPHHASILGGGLVVAFGLLTPKEAWSALVFLGPSLVTIASLMVVTVVAERSGLFSVLARTLAKAGRGDARRLFALLFFTGTLLGAVFTNDAAVLVLTPLVYRLIEQVADDDWSPAAKVPYYFGVLYIGNLVAPLIIGNPINIVVGEMLDIGFLEYATWMALPALAAIVVTYLGLRFWFRRSLPRRYKMPTAEVMADTDRRFLAVCAVVLGIALLGFFGQSFTGIPIAWVALGGAVVLLLAWRGMRGGSPVDIGRRLGWDVLVFVCGIHIVALGVRHAGATDFVAGMLMDAHEASPHAAHVVAAFFSGGTSAVINNHPVAQLMAMTIGDLPMAAIDRTFLALAALIGGDLGPKMLPIGSLAALLWFRMLADRGVRISWKEYVRLGIPVTLAAIAASVGVLTLQYLLAVS